MKALARRKLVWASASIVKWIIIYFILLINTINVSEVLADLAPTFSFQPLQDEYFDAAVASATFSLKKGRLSAVLMPTSKKEQVTIIPEVNSSNTLDNNVALPSNTQQKYIFSSSFCLGIEDIFIALFLVRILF